MEKGFKQIMGQLAVPGLVVLAVIGVLRMFGVFSTSDYQTAASQDDADYGSVVNWDEPVVPLRRGWADVPNAHVCCEEANHIGRDARLSLTHNTAVLEQNLERVQALGLAPQPTATFTGVQGEQQQAFFGQVCGSTPNIAERGKHVAHWKWKDGAGFHEWCTRSRAFALTKTPEEVRVVLAALPKETQQLLGDTPDQVYASMEAIWAGLSRAEGADGATCCLNRDFRGPLPGEVSMVTP